MRGRGGAIIIATRRPVLLVHGRTRNIRTDDNAGGLSRDRPHPSAILRTDPVLTPVLSYWYISRSKREPTGTETATRSRRRAGLISPSFLPVRGKRGSPGAQGNSSRDSSPRRPADRAQRSAGEEARPIAHARSAASICPPSGRTLHSRRRPRGGIGSPHAAAGAPVSQSAFRSGRSPMLMAVAA